MVEVKCEGEGSPALVRRRAGGTADSGGGERLEGSFEAAAASGRGLGVGGVWGVVDQLLTPIPFVDPSELPRPEFPALDTGVSGLGQRFRF